METPTLTALALVCSLKPSPAESSSQLIADQVLAALAQHGVGGSSVRLADFNIRFGVEADMGDGDQWHATTASLSASHPVPPTSPPC